MNQASPNQPKRDVSKTASILFVALLASVGIYAAVAAMLMGQANAGLDAEAMGTLRMVFLLLAAASTVGSLVLPKLVAGKQPQTDQSYLTGRILAWAFSESIALYGLVGALLGLGSDLVWTLIAWAGLAMLFHAPRGRKTTA